MQPNLQPHPGARRFEAIAAFADTPTRNSHVRNFETGTVSLGPRLIFPSALLALSAISLLGMKVTAQCDPHSYEGKDYDPFSVTAERRPVGFIDEAVLVGNKLIVRGYIWADFPNLYEAIENQAPPLGCCLDVRYPKVSKVDDKTLRLDAATFFGLAILRKENCGFGDTVVSIC